MTTKRAKWWLGLSMIASALFVAPGVFASAIFVDNFSFETLPAGGLPLDGCGAGCSFSADDPIPGWTGTDSSGFTPFGQFQPGVQDANFAFFNSIPDGITIGYSNGGEITQTVGSTVQLGIVYTLQVDQGLRNDGVPDPGIVELIIGGNAPIIATGVPASLGDWSTFTATYIGLAADVGKPITIALVSPGAQGDWDNVRLDAVPEPATLFLVGMGLIALVVVGARTPRQSPRL